MTKQIQNKIVTVVAILLLAIAVFLTVQLFIGDDSEEPETQAVQTTVTTAVPSTEYTEAETQDDETEEVSETSAPIRYLWDYGPGNKTADQG